MSKREDLLLEEVKFLREMVSSLMKQVDRLVVGVPNSEPMPEPKHQIDAEKMQSHLGMILGQETEGTNEEGLDIKRPQGDTFLS